jgi:RNA polymerase sigma-70 factor (ECF subfamily)
VGAELDSAVDRARRRDVARRGDSDGARRGDLDAAVRGAQGGDADAFRLLYRDLQPRLLRYLGTLVGEDAEDVASETWLQVARDLDGFTGDAGDFRGWVTTIARHRALDQIRRSSRRPEPVPVTPERLAALDSTGSRAGNTADDTAAGAIEAVSTDAALRLIATLPPDQAEAVLLRAVVGLDAATAASVAGKRPGAVRSAALRGLRTLAKRLADAGTTAVTAAPANDRVNNRATDRDNQGVTPGPDLALKDMR